MSIGGRRASRPPDGLGRRLFNTVTLGVIERSENSKFLTRLREISTQFRISA